MTDSGDDILAPGTNLGSYRIDRLLGRGGMGTVFLAYDTTLHRHVALKVVDAAADAETSRSRVLREARNAAALNHPNICTIHEVGEANGSAFIAMEYVEGRSLRDRLDEGPLPLADALEYGIQAADAIAYAHDHGVIHRDFKAANAIVTDTGRLKVVDFGLARRGDALMTSATTLASVVPAGAAGGTPYAMAPEQVRGEATDARTDIWALGVLLYELVCGAQPFRAATIPELFSSILRDAPAALPDAVPVALRAVIERCLKRAAERRYQHASEVRAALDAVQMGTVAAWVGWRYRLSRRRWLLAATALFGVGAVVVGLNVGGMPDRLPGHSSATAPIRLAVLPFENLTGDPEQEYFSDGLTEEMITQLGRLHPQRLSVIARTSSMHYKKRDLPIDQIGRELGVQYVLEGSARREGGRVRISATLIEVADQTQRWSDTFERELTGILTLQSDVARGVAGSLSLTLLPDEQARLANARPITPEAYEAYLKGRFHWQKLTRQELDTAERQFQLALEKDPSFALAYVDLGIVWGVRCNMGIVPCRETLPEWRGAVQRAASLDPTLPEVQAALAGLKFYADWDWQAAEVALRRALELNGRDPVLRVWYSEFLLYIAGRTDEGVAEMRRALELDPHNSTQQAWVSQALVTAGRYDEAIAYLQEVLQKDPNVPLARGQLQMAYEAKQMYNEAMEVWRQTLASTNDREVAEAVERGYAMGGYRGAKRLRAELAVRRSQRSYVPATSVAGFYAGAGERELALDWLEKAYDEHDVQLVRVFKGNPRWESLRDHPRFQDLLRRMNLLR